MYRHIVRVPVQVARKPRYLKHGKITRGIQTSSNHHKGEGKEPPKEECPDSGSGRGFYKTLGAVVIGTGAVVAYAKYDDDFRAWLRDNVPGSDGFISFITAEETTPVDYAWRSIDSAKQQLVDAVGSIVGTDDKPEVKSGKSIDANKKSAQPPCDDDGKPYNPKKAAEDRMKAIEENKKREQASQERPKQVKGIEAPKEPAKKKSPPPPAQGGKPKADVAVIEKEISQGVALAVKAYQEAICHLQDYTTQVNNIVEESVEKQDPKIWSQLRQKTHIKDENVKKAMEIVQNAEANIAKLEKDLNNPSVEGSEEQKMKSRANVKGSLKKLKDTKDEFFREKNTANVSNSYWTLVQQAREHFQDELSTLFPNFSLSDKQMKLAEAEMDLFILYAFQSILYYQKELTKLDTLGQAKLKVALQQSHIGDPNAIECVIEQEVEKEKRKICSDYQKKLLNLRAECEQKAKEAIKNHSVMYTELMQEALGQKEKDVLKKMKRQMDDQLVQEKEKYREEMAGLLGRLKGMDELMKRRAGQEKRAVEAQLLWSACEGLVSAITCERDCTAVSMRSLKDHIHAIELAASKDDELVQAVVATIPKKAVERGVFGEPALRERFANTSRVARRVALLPEGGASLPVMLISYLQSLLIISPTIPIPCHELNNEPFHPESLNTFEIIQRSKYWMDRGDWYQVLRYMNLLQGAPRVIAQDFLDEVKIFLETKQAADVLIAHASANALAV